MWLNNNILDSAVDIHGFTMVQVDRDLKVSGKKKGRQVVLFVNHKWFNPEDMTVKERICCHDIEMLAFRLRPYYVLREFSHVVVIIVYIPPRADAEPACDIVQSTVVRLQTQHPNTFVKISGDFSHVTFTSHLNGFTQFVDCQTRNNMTIDLLYANVKDAYILICPVTTGQIRS